MKVKASPELGKLLVRAVEALETIAAAAQAITAEDRATGDEAAPWQGAGVPGALYSAEERRKHNLWLLGEPIGDSEATEEVSGDAKQWADILAEKPNLSKKEFDRLFVNQWPGAGEASGTMQLDVGADEARWMGEERRVAELPTRRNGEAERRQGDERRTGEPFIGGMKSPESRKYARRVSDLHRTSAGDLHRTIVLPRRQIGDDLHGRREIVSPGDSFDEVTAASDETPDDKPDESVSLWMGAKDSRIGPSNRRSETEQRMRTRRRPHDRRKRAKPGWMEEQRSGDDRRDGVDRRNPSGPRRFNDGRREADS